MISDLLQRTTKRFSEAIQHCLKECPKGCDRACSECLIAQLEAMKTENPSPADNK